MIDSSVLKLQKMKAKVLTVLAVFSMISLGGIAQGFNNESGFGLNGYKSFGFQNTYEPDRRPKFSFVSPSENGIYEMPSQVVINKMTCTDEITSEQVQLIFDIAKEFPEHTEISIAFINNGLVFFYGLKRDNSTILNIDNHSSVFEIGSITKVFTATLLANYVNDGTLEIEDPINNYLPFNMHDNIQISFKELANHTSGLPRIPSNMMVPSILSSRNPYKDYSDLKLEKYLMRKVKVTDQPESFVYSNLGFGLLGYTLSKIENKSYNDLLHQKIFSKFGMTNSSTVRSEPESDLVRGLNKNGSKTPNWDFASLESAGAILSTTEDLSKFAVAQFDETDKDLALTRELTFSINENEAIGLGWFIYMARSGEVLYRHKGVTRGYTSAMIIDTENRTGIIILSNVSGVSKKIGNIDTLCFDLLATFSKNKYYKAEPQSRN